MGNQSNSDRNFHWAIPRDVGLDDATLAQIASLTAKPDTLKVSVVTGMDAASKNRLFCADWMLNDHWMEPHVELFRRGMQQGVLFATDDLLPPAKADLVLYFNLGPYCPPASAALDHGRPRILFLTESPANKPYWFIKDNHRQFDAIITYNPKLVDGVRYFAYRFSVGSPRQQMEDLPFASRRVSVLLNSNYNDGVLNAHRPWIPFQRLLATRKTYRFGVWDAISCLLHTSYSERRALARAAESVPDAMDVYGVNWHGCKHGWFRRFFPEAPFRCHRGVAVDNKLLLLSRYRFAFAVENYCGDVGYVSEKILDAYHAGCVPVYLGDSNIGEMMPRDSFVDIRNFGSRKRLFQHLVCCNEKQWIKMRDAGKSFLNSPAMKPFEPASFAQDVIDVVRRTAARRQT